MARRKLWAFSTGQRGARARVFERRKDGLLYGWTSADPPGYRRPLGHADKDKAKQWAKDQAALLQLGRLDSRVRATVGATFAGFLLDHGPNISANQLAHLTRCGTLWSAFLGTDTELIDVSHSDLQRFVRERTAGRVDAHGARVREPRPVRTRAVQRDLQALRTCCRWATAYRPQPGSPPMLAFDPTKGFRLPAEKNVRRAVATDDRYDALMAVAGQVAPALPVLLVLVHETGRRITPVRKLRRSDLDFDTGPHGAIVWPHETDKQGKLWAAPLTARARQALDRWLAVNPVIGDAVLFPSPQHPTRAMSRWLARDWLHRAEALAGLTPLDGAAWHAYRRAWATKRKGLPVQDVAAAGGWSDYRVLQRIYQQPDFETIRRVVDDATELRDVGKG